MFDPKYRLLIPPESFPEDRCICLGNQLISIINVLEKFSPPHNWYGADVEAIGKGLVDLNLGGFQLKFIGSDKRFVSCCLNISQFVWGVFLCVSQDFLPSNIELGTEDEPFRTIFCNGVLVEIRMFDASYIEIYSEDEVMIKKISNHFPKSRLEMKP